VIVPFWNAAQTLEPCLRALTGQDLPADDIELLLVDNNSTDRSAEIVERHHGVRLLREAKQGAYAARNRALTEAEGSLIAFTDPDCVPEPDWLRRLVAPFADPEVCVLLGRSLPVGDSTALAAIADYERAKEELVFASDDPQLYYGHTNNMATRRSAFDELGDFEERARGADTIFVRRVVDRYSCGSVRYCPEARVHHLELDNPRSWLRKVQIYGRSAASYGLVVATRPLSRREHWRVVRAANAGQPLHRRMILLTLVLLESLAWRWSQLRIGSA
jgi:cellulose synthase/poly-beta-1,6-N-acetylglucosamine synthase-like glycosyltransferase